MKKAIFGAAMLISAPAYAADVYVEQTMPVVQDGFSWSGFYVGLRAGYSFADGDWSQTIPGAIVTADGDLGGFLIGVYAGAQHQFANNVVLGAEIDLDYRDGSDTAPHFINGFPFAPFSLASEINWTGSARLRAGYAMDRWLPYVTGGFAFASYEGRLLAAGVPIPGPFTTFSDTSVGWTVGFGTEYAFTDNLILRGEYRYSDFGDTATQMLPFVVGTPQSYELNSHEITIGISYKF